MNYFLDIFVGCMFLAFFDRLLLSCFSVGEEEEKRGEDKREYKDIDFFGRTNSDSCVVKVRYEVKRTKTI
jgi:hypothetical protein